jgi:two-component system, cell cycle response regulator DivK
MGAGDSRRAEEGGRDHLSDRERRVGSRPQRVLVVDDQQDLRDLWECWLTICGFRVCHAENGLEGVLAATAHPPHLILMDIWMPVMDGWRATQLLKEAPQTAHVPIVALTAVGDCEDSVARAEAVGCDAFLCKPCEPDDLLQSIRNVLRRARLRLGPVRLPLATPREG